MYKNTPYVLRALVLGTLLATTGLSFVSANTNTTTHTPAVASTKAEASTVGNTKAVTPKTDVSNVEATKVESPKFDAANVPTCTMTV